MSSAASTSASSGVCLYLKASNVLGATGAGFAPFEDDAAAAATAAAAAGEGFFACCHTDNSELFENE